MTLDEVAWEELAGGEDVLPTFEVVVVVVVVVGLFNIDDISRFSRGRINVASGCPFSKRLSCESSRREIGSRNPPVDPGVAFKRIFAVVDVGFSCFAGLLCSSLWVPSPRLSIHNQLCSEFVKTETGWAHRAFSPNIACMISVTRALKKC